MRHQSPQQTVNHELPQGAAYSQNEALELFGRPVAWLVEQFNDRFGSG